MDKGTVYVSVWHWEASRDTQHPSLPGFAPDLYYEARHHALTRCSIYTRLLIPHPAAHSLPSQQRRLWSRIAGFRVEAAFFS